MASKNIRENLVNTAVKFLQNPKVKDSPEGQKRLFLERKGLTPEEIDAAIAHSNTDPNEKGNVYHSPNNSAGSTEGPLSSPINAQVPPVVIPSRWSRARDVTFTAALIGGVTYAVYRFIKRTVLPFLRGEESEYQRLRRVEKTVGQMDKNMTQMLSRLNTTMTSIEAIMNQQQEKLQTVVHEVVDKQHYQNLLKFEGQQSSNEIKTEIASLKSLLLSRRQFAPAPQTSPIIPAWQREEKKDSASKRSPSEDRSSSNSNGNESTGSIEEKSSWVKVDTCMPKQNEEDPQKGSRESAVAEDTENLDSSGDTEVLDSEGAGHLTTEHLTTEGESS